MFLKKHEVHDLFNKCGWIVHVIATQCDGSSPVPDLSKISLHICSQPQSPARKRNGLGQSAGIGSAYLKKIDTELGPD